MKKIARAGALLLFVTLIFCFVAYRSGAFNPTNRKIESQLTSQPREQQGVTKKVLVDSPVTTGQDSSLPSGLKIDSLIEVNPLIFSSKSMIVNENWNEHAAAVAKIVRQMDSIKKQDSIQRTKEWETVSPR